MAANMQKRSKQERFGASACKAGSDSSAPMSGGKLEVQRAFPPMSRLVHERTHRNIHFLWRRNKQSVLGLQACLFMSLVPFYSCRQDVMKWNAWGYKDSGFFVNENGIMEFAGRRYLIAGKELPRLQPLMQKYGLDTSLQSFSPVRCM